MIGPERLRGSTEMGERRGFGVYLPYVTTLWILYYSVHLQVEKGQS